MKWLLSLLLFFQCFCAYCHCSDQSSCKRSDQSTYQRSEQSSENEINEFIEEALQKTSSPNFLVVGVSRGALKIEPRIHFDTKNYQRGCGVIGHCWALLVEQGDLVWIGGHSGETQDYPPRYLDGYARLAHHGSLEDLGISKDLAPARNPISYLHHQREDGFFQEGDGGYQADYALLIPLSSHALKRVAQVKTEYCFQKYALFTHQCCHFVMELLGACGNHIESVQREVESELRMGKVSLPLWTDPKFSRIEFMSPDALIKRLEALNQKGCGIEVSALYKKHQKKSTSKLVDKRVDKVLRRLIGV